MKRLSNAQFLKYYWEYHEKIYRYLFFRAYEDRALAEDLTSETFLKAFEKLDTFDSDQKFSAWLYAIARNTLIDYFRKNKRNTEMSLDDHEQDFVASENLVDQLNQKLTRQQLLKAVQKLPENLREVVLLKYFNDYKNSEIEELLALNPNTLRTHLHRAIKQLQTFVPLTLLSVILFFLFL